MKITVYTDPGCPFGFNAQRQDLQLLWHYGHSIEVEKRMIVLSSESATYEQRGITRAMVVGNTERLSGLYGMPMTMAVNDRAVATIDGCRAYLGALLHEPARADRLLRALRVRAFTHGQALDDPATLHGAAEDAGIASQAIDAWLRDPEVEERLRADMAAARDPLPEALALPHRLSSSNGTYRYSTASAVLERAGRRVVAPGFQPFAVHEVAVANVAPAIERRPAPDSARDVLAWADYPLATAEVAEIRGVTITDARAELADAGATFVSAANDGYWSA